jgi:hypothetical protein
MYTQLPTLLDSEGEGVDTPLPNVDDEAPPAFEFEVPQPEPVCLILILQEH